MTTGACPVVTLYGVTPACFKQASSGFSQETYFTGQLAVSHLVNLQDGRLRAKGISTVEVNFG